MVDVLFAMSWLLSLAFLAMIGFSLGYRQAHKDRVQFVDTLKGAVFQLVEKVKGHAEKENHPIGDRDGGAGCAGLVDAPEEVRTQNRRADNANRS